MLVSESLQINGPSVALVAPVDLTEACLATPAFRAIRNARADLTPVVLCPRSALPFWQIHFPQALSYDDDASPQKLAERFSSGTYHSAVILEDSKAARALSRLGVEQRLGFNTPELAKIITAPVNITMANGPLPHRVTRYLELAEKLGCEPRKAENFSPPPLPPRPATPRIALAPDSDLGPAAQWPTSSYLTLTEQLDELKPEFFLLSMPNITAAADELTALMSREQSKKAKSNNAEDCGLEQLLAILPTFSTLITPNGTLAHLAAHLGLPTVTLMGPHDPRTHRPLGKIHQVLTTHAECSPCHLSKCPLDHRCLEELSPETVAQAVRHILQHKEQAQNAS